MATFRNTRLIKPPDMHVRYGGGVTSIDRAAWAGVVAQLIESETAGNTTHFGQLVGVNYKTVRRWLTQQSDVSEESVRQVARAIGVSPLELLLRCGVYTEADVANVTNVPAPVSDTTAIDAAEQEILRSNLPPHVKKRFLARLEQLRDEEAARHVKEVRWWIEQSGGA